MKSYSKTVWGNTQQTIDELGTAIQQLSSAGITVADISVGKVVQTPVSFDFSGKAIPSAFENWLTDEVVTDWWKRAEYRKKHNDYRRLLTHWLSDEFLIYVKSRWDGEDIFDRAMQSRYWSYESGVTDDALRRRSFSCEIIYSEKNQGLFHVVNHLIDYSDKLSQSYNKQLESKFLALEAELLRHLSYEDLWVLKSTADNHQKSIKEIYQKFLHGSLLFLIRKVRKFRKPDLRQRLRNIIHFLFQNMSDETDSSHSLPFFFKRKELITSKLIFNEHKTKAGASLQYTG